MGMREWLLVGGIVVIIGILIDGFVRMQRAKRKQIKMALEDVHLPDDYDEHFNSELPAGGARVLSRDGAGGLEGEVRQEVRQGEENVPVLMERVDHPDGVNDEELKPESFSAGARLTDSFQAEIAFPKTQDEADSTSARVRSNITDVIVINLMAKNDEVFAGTNMLQVFTACGLRFGEMNVFHRHADINGNGPVLYSVANIVNPGIFELDKMDQFSTPGLTFFLRLPSAIDNMHAFDKMMDTIGQVKNSLGGEMKDENRSVVTTQTLEHCRQRIRDFELRQLSPAQKA